MNTLSHLRHSGFSPPRIHRNRFTAFCSAALASVFCRSSSVTSSVNRRRNTFTSAHCVLPTAVAIALTANVGSALSTYPHTLSYFNETIGGPLYGAKHLLDANIDWGQDVTFLKEWCAAHPRVTPLYVASAGFAELEASGIESQLIRCPGDRSVVAAGWNLASVGELSRYNCASEIERCCARLRRDAFVYRIAYSSFVFHLLDDPVGPE